MSKKNGENAGEKALNRNPGAELDKTPLYYTYEDGFGFKHKVANLEHPRVCPRKGIIEIEHVSKKNTIEPLFKCSIAEDRELGIFFGVPTGIDPKTKLIVWRRFQIGDRKRYDLSKREEAIEWAIVSRQAWMEGSPNQLGKVWYKKIDKEAEAHQVIAKATIRNRAIEIVSTLVKYDEQADIYRVFGNNPAGFSPTQLTAELYKIAERSPKEFIEAFENKNKDVLFTFKRCIEVGIITFDATKGGFLFKGGVPMGLTESAAVDYLMKNPSMYADANMNSIAIDPVQARLKISDSEKKFFGIDDNDGMEDPELLDLRVQAKFLGVANYMTLDKNKLSEAVESAANG